ncbi:hypothetical protein P4118_21410 [Pseudomonas aeruginosa]|nr:hypothetical protein [Pseudomonas aeruginosa]
MHCAAVIERFGMRAEDCELRFYSINFDAASERLLARSLLRRPRGAAGPGPWGAEEICELIRAEGVSILGFTPSYGSQLAQWLESQGPAVAGAHVHHRRRSADRRAPATDSPGLRPASFFNAYGPTETVDVRWPAWLPNDWRRAPPACRSASGRCAGHYILDATWPWCRRARPANSTSAAPAWRAAT